MITKQYAFDALERLSWTFVQTFAATVLLFAGFSLDALYAALVAGGLSVLKSIVALNIGTAGTASTLPADLDPASESDQAPIELQ